MQPPKGIPAVSVIIPTYNRGALLERSIHSVLAQTFADLEVIVVDDGSTDDTERRVLALQDPRLRYVRHSASRGAPVARNTGVENAKGNLIAFQDSDDVWLIDKLEMQVAMMRAHQPITTVVYSGFVKWKAGTATYFPKKRETQRSGHILPQLLKGNLVSTQTILAPRRCLEEVGGFDPNLRRFQDWELVIRLADRFQFKIVDEPLVMVYDTQDSISRNLEALAESLAAILEKHQERFAQYPGLRARHLTYLGHCLCAMGDTRMGRKHLRQALRGNGGFLGAWLVLLVSYLGPTAYRAIANRAFPRDRAV